MAIFEAFKHWQHYLEGSASLVDVVTDHKNLEYFSSSKVLTHRQACWSEYLSQFNLAIHFPLDTSEQSPMPSLAIGMSTQKRGIGTTLV